MAEAHELTMLQQAAAVRAGDLSPVDLADHYLRRAERFNGAVGAYLTITAERALDDARRAERTLAAGGDLPPLLGVPVPVKDLMPVAGLPFTQGSAVFSDHVAKRDTDLGRRLRDAGTVLLGKTNTPEFGLPAYTEGKAGPAARTPWDLTRGAGGSSGGAAAAVATGLAPAAHGSDGGGSIRIPASCCGLVGLKPSRGRVSRAPYSEPSGLAVDGPITWTVEDAAALLDVMAGPVAGDLFTLPLPGTSFLEQSRRVPGRLRIARWAQPDVPGVPVDPQVLAAYEDTALLLADLGHEVEEIPQPLAPGERDTFTPVWSVLAAMTPVPEGREQELMPLSRWLREQGHRISGLGHAQALVAMQAVGRKLARAVAPYDAVLTPTLAQLPAPVGSLRNDDDPEADFAAQIAFTPFTALWNIVGCPAISLPLGWATVPGAPREGTAVTGTADTGGPDSDAIRLPVGVMLAGRHGEEGALLALAAQIEAARPWHAHRPPLAFSS